MPRGPKGEKRPADVVGAAVTVAKIATGEIEETTDDGKNKAAQELGRNGEQAQGDGEGAHRHMVPRLGEKKSPAAAGL